MKPVWPFRHCPAAVIGNDPANSTEAQALGSGGVGEGPRLPAHESEDLPTATRCTPRGAGCGVFEGKTAGDVVPWLLPTLGRALSRLLRRRPSMLAAPYRLCFLRGQELRA